MSASAIQDLREETVTSVCKISLKYTLCILIGSNIIILYNINIYFL